MADATQCCLNRLVAFATFTLSIGDTASLLGGQTGKAGAGNSSPGSIANHAHVTSRALSLSFGLPHSTSLPAPGRESFRTTHDVFGRGAWAVHWVPLSANPPIFHTMTRATSPVLALTCSCCVSTRCKGTLRVMRWAGAVLRAPTGRFPGTTQPNGANRLASSAIQLMSAPSKYVAQRCCATRLRSDSERRRCSTLQP